MQRLKKNLTFIQQKFQSLKSTHKSQHQHSSIGQISQIMTNGVIRESQVNKYLQYLHSNPQLYQKQKISQNWYELDIKQMILFLDKIIKYRNVNRPKDNNKNTEILDIENLNMLMNKKKVKRKHDSHQNPYIPGGIGTGKQAEVLNQQNNQENIINRQVNIDSNMDSYASTNQLQQQQQQQTQFSLQCTQIDLLSSSISNQQNSLITNSLSLQQRYSSLLSSFLSLKQQIQKKFSYIYSHYRKQMYIPYESFDKNNQLMMDLRIFLKYYREFQIANKYKTTDATNWFKKEAVNGLWLNLNKFIIVHYKLIELLDINQNNINKTSLQNHNNNNSISLSKQLKQQFSRNIKNLLQNILKLKLLSQLINNQRSNKILNCSPNKMTIKKIVQIHSGLSKQDVMLKLTQRNQQRKKKSQNMIINTINKKLGRYQQLTNSPQNNNNNKYSLSPSKLYQLSVYKQLQLPRLKDRQLKKSSIYSSLQLLNIYKEKEKLKFLINQEENQKYLEQYFKKQKILNKELKMHRNYSLGVGEMKRQIDRYNNNNINNKSINNIINNKNNNNKSISKKLSTEESLLQSSLSGRRNNINNLNSSSDKNYYSANVMMRNNLSLPRMKFN